MMRKKILILLCLVISSGLLSENLKIKRIDTRLGLSSDLVTDIRQDSEGFIWIATTDGLNCYTGSDFIINNTKELKSTNVTKICIASDGDMWLGTSDAGIIIYNRLSGRTQVLDTRSEENRIAGDKITNLLCDSRGRVWIVSDGGLNCYDPQKKQMQYLEISPNKPNVNVDITTIFEDSKGHILVGAWWRSVYYYCEEDGVFYSLLTSDGSDINRVWSFAEDTNGDLWIGTWGKGLYKARFKNKSYLEILHHENLANEEFLSETLFNIVYDIKVDSNDRIWIGSDSGLGLVENSDDDSFNVKWSPLDYGEGFGLAKDIVTIFFDAEKSMWLGTFDHGVCFVKLDGEIFKTNFTSNDSRQPSMNSFTTFWEEKGKIFAGVQSLGFGEYDFSTNSIIPYKRLPDFEIFKDVNNPINAVSSCQKVDEKYLWMMMRYKGLVRYDIQSNELFYPNISGLSGENLPFLLEKDQFWIGSSNLLSVFIKDNASVQKNFPYKRINFGKSRLPKLKISSIIRGANGRLWVSSLDGGVFEVIEPNKDESHYQFIPIVSNTNSEFDDLVVQTLFSDSKGDLWIGTNGGGVWLYSPEKETLTNFNYEFSVWGNSVFGILEDDFQRIWLSTNKGISRITLLTGEIIHYTIADGLQGNVFVKNATFKDTKGNLYFGGYHGFNKFDPRSVSFNDYVPPLAFTSISIDNDPVHLDYIKNEPLIINHKKNSFAIEFVALSYKNSDDNHYSYMLEGFDNNWLSTNAKNNKVIYGRIPPGKYTFKLRGSNNNGIWNSVPLKLSIVVKNSPFKTFWAYCLYFLMMTIILLLVFYYWKQDFKLKQAYREEQDERRRGEKLNQYKLLFFTNISHELLTPLSIISNAIEQTSEKKSYFKSDLDIISRNTNRLTKLINQLLDFRKVEAGSKKLQVAECNFDLLVESLSSNFNPLCENKNIMFELSGYVEKNITLDLDKLDKILHNLLSNAFKFTPEQGTIRLEYRVETKENVDYLYVSVSDSGKGISADHINHIFDRFYRVEGSENTNTTGTGIGLSFTKALIDLHKGDISVSNIYNSGACFEFSIPVSSQCYTSVETIKSTDTPPVKSAEFFMDIARASDSLLIQQAFVKRHDCKVLLVEDNSDMREILKNYLSSFYEVYEAENGLAALEILKKVEISLVVSDVMMPLMDGIELCKTIKSNAATSHIPVILTTAKRSQEDFIEGYGARADSYVTKPVNMKLLYVRINNILTEREELKKLFTSNTSKIVLGKDIQDADVELLDRVNGIIQSHISDASLSVTMIYNQIERSESVIFRKVKAMTGMSPNQYIRQVRLSYASQLLKKGLKPMEVCFQSGFTDPSYFSSCFKKQFGVTPSKYQ